MLGPACHVLYRYTTGEACGPNMITRNSFALNTEFVAPRFEWPKRPASAARAARSQHGRRQEAQRPVLRRWRARQNSAGRSQHPGADTAERASHDHAATWSRWSTSACTAAMPATCSRWRSRPRRPWRRSSPRPARTWAWSAPAAWRTTCSNRYADEAASTWRSASPGLEVGTVGGGTGMPHARAFLSLLGCSGPGSAYRLAQIIAAAALCLELSAAASAATPGSENFALTHLASSGRK